MSDFFNWGDNAGSPPDIPLGRSMDDLYLLPNKDTLASLTLSDDGNAERLVLVYGEDLRFCHAFKKWLIFEHGVWRPDTQDRAVKMAARVMRITLLQAIAAAPAGTQKFTTRSLDDSRLRAMLRQAQRSLPVSVDELDRHPELLAFRNGTVDLRSGELRPGERGDFITKMVPHDYCPDAGCPQFLAFLDGIMGGGPDASEVAEDVFWTGEGRLKPSGC